MHQQICTVEEALEELRSGRLIITIDDPDRENEGDLICAARFATTENVNFMAVHGKGLICTPMSEEVAARLVYELLRRGGRKVSFDPIVAAGANGSMPHAVPGEMVLQSGMFVTMDFGCVYEGYCSDMTRTVAVGQPTEEMERVYHTVLEAQRAGISAARAGVTGSEVDWAARQVIQQAGYGAFFSHSFGHSLGLEIHESPNASSSEQKVLPAGAVISAEPGIYLPGRFGVRIEDVLVLREGGCEDITQSPKNLIVL